MSKRNTPHFEDEDQPPQAGDRSEQDLQEESISDGQQESFSESEIEESEMEEAEESPLLTREMKIGLAVVLVLIVVLGALLIKRFPLGGGSQEDKQATAKADGKSTGSSSGGSSGNPTASAVPKPAGAEAGGSGSRGTPSSETGPRIPTSGGLGSKQLQSGTTKSLPEGSNIPFPSPSPASPGTSGNVAEGKAKIPSQGASGGTGSGSGFGGTQAGSSLAPMSPWPARESVFSGNNPLRADSAVSPAAAPSAPKEAPPASSNNASGPLLSPTSEAHAPPLQQGQRQESPPSLTGGYPSSTGSFSPYAPPVWGSPTSGSAESSRESGQASSGAERGAGGLTASQSGRELTPLPSGSRSTAPASATGGNSPAAAGLGSPPAGSPAPSSQNESFLMPRSYVVQPGDSFWGISERFYGTGSYYQALAEYNRSRNPRLDQLRVGDQLMIPSQEELRRLYPQLCATPAGKDSLSATPGGASGSSPALLGGYPPAKPEASGAIGGFSDRTGSGTTVPPSGKTYRVYIVQEGDSIYEIARALLGKASRWVEIYELNKEVIGENLEYLPPGTRLAIPPAEPGNSPGPMSGVPPRSWSR